MLRCAALPGSMKTDGLIVLAVFCFLLLTSSSVLGEQKSADEWQFGVTIYGWFPSIDGTLLYDAPPDSVGTTGSGGNISVDASDILDNLDLTFMGAFEARRGKWSVLSDLIYLKLSNDKNSTLSIGPGSGIPINAEVDQVLEAWIVMALLGYAVVQQDQVRMDILGGVRYLSLDADAKLSVNGPLPPTPPPAKLSQSVSLWDGIVGVRGQFDLSDRWSVPYYADVGTGDSDLTWQVLLGVTYRFDWGDVRLAYRHLAYDQKDDRFIQDAEFSGPALGVGFRF
ncbi:MAG: hypothetical protein HC808_08120 [Candidatus Competibacteraceae bacterium]|nr:hypothetical protein [Candidatus Competibacteraceae bacterium]